MSRQNALHYDRTVSGALVYYLYPDQVGTPRLVTDSSNNIVWRHILDEPFGNTPPEENPSGLGVFKLNIRGQGQYADAESNLIHNGYRDIDPLSGRYIQFDPLGLAAGINGYAFVNNDPLRYTDPYGLFGVEDLPSIPQSVVDFSAGFGDTLSFGATNWARNQLGTNGAVDKCSNSYLGGEIAGIALDTAIGGAAGWEAAGARGAGKEFSHWVPNRMGGPRSKWNGNYVPTEEHALSDPYRYQFMPRAWKAENPMPNAASQQWDRIPNVYKGAAAGGAYGAAGAAQGSDCGCQK